MKVSLTWGLDDSSSVGGSVVRLSGAEGKTLNHGEETGRSIDGRMDGWE